MPDRSDIEGVFLTPPDHQGARPKDSYFPLCDDHTSELKAEYKRVKSHILRIARHYRRQSELSRSESSRSLSPAYWRSFRRSCNLPKFKIATFYPTDVKLWFNQIETQFDLHDITDERYRLTCAALSGEVASDVRDVLLQPFIAHKYANLKRILIKRRGLPMPERVTKVIYGEKLGSDIPKDCWIRNFGSCQKCRDTPGIYSANACFYQSPFGNSAG